MAKREKKRKNPKTEPLLALSPEGPLLKKKSAGKTKGEKPKRDVRKGQQFGVFIMIPFILAVPPIIGWFIGRWLDSLLGTGPHLKYVFLILGIFAGARECYRMIKEYGDEI